MNERVTGPVFSCCVVVPDPVSACGEIVGADPAETEELGADGVGVAHGADGGEAAGSAERAGGLANGAGAPPVDGAVGATEGHDLVGVRSVGVA